MNPHLLQGTIAFVLWSVFASWYYVNNIKEDEEPDIQPQETAVQAVEETVPEPIVKVDSADNNTIVSIPIDLQTIVYFDLNSSTITDQENLDRFVDSVAKLPDDEYLLQLTGYTCNIGSNQYNDSLSKIRADVIADFLIPKMNNRTTVDVTGNGERNPVASNETEEERSKNRRVVIKLTN